MTMPYVYEDILSYRASGKTDTWIAKHYKRNKSNLSRFMSNQKEARSKTPEQINVLMDKRLKPMKPKSNGQKKRLHMLSIES